MITVIDYGAGNLRSVANAVRYLGETPVIESDADRIAVADKLILPGVGAFGECMKLLSSRGADEAIKTAVARGTPLLGICLGLQLLFDSSDEFGEHKGLGLIRGKVTKLKADGLNLPHIAWTSIQPSPSSRLMRGIKGGEYFYFVHSYCAHAENASDEAATAVYGEIFTAAAEKDNVFGVQFHPEKSGSRGLKLLGNFIEL